MYASPNLFENLPRNKNVKRAHVCDAMSDRWAVVKFHCDRCDWRSDWIDAVTVTKAKRGIPCPNCN